MAYVYIINTGDELIYGDTLNKDGKIIAEKLYEFGFEVKKIVCLKDDTEGIRREISYAVKQADLIILTGGLGLGPKDITREVVKDFFKLHFVIHEESYEKIKKFYKSDREDVKKQAMVPESSVVFYNRIGLAPGFAFEVLKSVIVLPGPPDEILSMWKDVEKYIKNKFDKKKIYTHIFRVYKVFEADIKKLIRDINTDIKIQLRKPGIDLILRSYDEIDNKIIEKLRNRLKDYLYTENDKNIEEILGEILRKHNLTLSVFESCTGGLVQNLITDVSGSSDYFVGGSVVYSNRLKVDICGVRRETLQKYGAVSRQTVYEMVKGGMNNFNTDTAIGISGIAGPNGGTKEKPVGVVYIGVGYRNKIMVNKYLFTGVRVYIKKQSAFTSIFDLIKLIKRIL